MTHPDYAHAGPGSIRLIEEAAELSAELADLIKAICKAERFGWDGYHPHRPKQLSGLPNSNREEVLDRISTVMSEIDDVMRLCREMRIRLGAEH